MATDSIVYAYSIDKDQWSKFTGLDLKHADILVGVAERDNVNLIIGESGNIFEFPGSEYTEEESLFMTKRYPMFGGKIRRVSLEYEGGDPLLTVIAHNRRMPTGYVAANIAVEYSGKFYGIPLGFKCDYVQFKVVGAHKIKMIRYTTV